MQPGEEDTLHGPVSDLDATLSAGAGTPQPRRDGSTSDLSHEVPDWGHFRDLHFLGEGGMGRVFRARDIHLDREVALKFIRGGDDPELRERLKREARAQARIEHPAICPVFEVAEAHGRLYVAMQLIDGHTLKTAAGDMSLEEKLRVIRDVARGVHEAHRLGIIHRDLKPRNIMVERDEDGSWRPYVVDFGLAREAADAGDTATGVMSGTPHYMAPEQIRKTPLGIDRRADVYGLGATLYETLLGRKLFEGSTEGIDLFMRILDEDPEAPRSIDPSLPADVETIVLTCLAKDPARRYTSARALAEEIDRFLDGEPIEARRAGIGYRLGKSLRKHKLLFSVVAIATVAVIAMGSWSIYSWYTAAEKARAAQAFGHKVASIDAIARQSALLPKHPVAAERRSIRVLMDDVRALSDEIGAPARGPADYALGRGYLALQELGRAREHLQRAWRAGYRSPDVAYGLGLVLGRLYQRARREASLLEDDATRRRRLAEAVASLRTPALAYLRQSDGAQVGSRAYVEAQIAMHEARYRDALERAAVARADAAWLYEADLLAGDAHRILGDTSAENGKYDQAAASYAEADRAYRVAATVGRSDALVYQGWCSLYLSRFKLAVHGTGGELEAHHAAGKLACEDALTVDPALGDPHLLISRLHYARGEWLADTGKDPTAALEASVVSAKRLIAASPDDPAGPEARALAELRLAYAELERGDDPGPRLDEILSLLEQTRARHPRRGELFNLIGIGHHYIAYYRRENGGDTLAAVARAVAAFERSVALEEQYLQAHLNLGSALMTRAEVELADGTSPETTIGKAVTAYEAALAINPKSAFTMNDLGYSHVLLARYQIKQGRDPRPSLGNAVTRLEQAAAIKPDDGYIASDIGAAHLTRATYELDNDLDAAAATRAGLAALTRAVELRKSDVEARVALARAHVAAARQAARSSHAPGPDLERATRAASEALALNDRYADAHRAHAEIAYWQGALSRDRDARRRGLASVARALEINKTFDVSDIRRKLESLPAL